ncbi:hypothetical protein MtrunA17_Chr2g0301481 [Medicago truncatula]|uniref:Uncharacterized protein n=1 Tax=Medicago truncatula TaxID=3880 RepID=A0A396JAU1_MEDTR|nr:hypothetical protein MtrunA17_Chr2g0301481 [Medicago truncatula]
MILFYISLKKKITYSFGYNTYMNLSGFDGGLPTPSIFATYATSSIFFYYFFIFPPPPPPPSCSVSLCFPPLNRSPLPPSFPLEPEPCPPLFLTQLSALGPGLGFHSTLILNFSVAPTEI